MLARGGVESANAAAIEPPSFKQRTRVLECEIVDPLHLRVQRAIDAVDLLVKKYVGAAAERGETFIVRGLELLEHLHNGVVLAARCGRDAGLVLRCSVVDVVVHLDLLGEVG